MTTEAWTILFLLCLKVGAPCYVVRGDEFSPPVTFATEAACKRARFSLPPGGLVRAGCIKVGGRNYG
jgi:hypothetical protein